MTPAFAAMARYDSASPLSIQPRHSCARLSALTKAGSGPAEPSSRILARLRCASLTITTTVRDAEGGRFTLTAVVLVESPAIVTARFQNLWNGLKARLIAGDTPGALAQISPAIRSQFSRVFQALGQNLSTIAGTLETLAVVENLDDLAEAVIQRREGATSSLYFIYFRRDSLGRWLIEEM